MVVSIKGYQKVSIYTGDEIQNISALGNVLQEIRARLISEGVSIDNERKKLSIKPKIKSNV